MVCKDLIIKWSTKVNFDLSHQQIVENHPSLKGQTPLKSTQTSAKGSTIEKQKNKNDTP